VNSSLSTIHPTSRSRRGIAVRYACDRHKFRNFNVFYPDIPSTGASPAIRLIPPLVSRKDSQDPVVPCVAIDESSCYDAPGFQIFILFNYNRRAKQVNVLYEPISTFLASSRRQEKMTLDPREYLQTLLDEFQDCGQSASLQE